MLAELMRQQGIDVEEFRRSLLEKFKMRDLIRFSSGMSIFLLAVREDWPIDKADRDTALVRLEAMGRRAPGRLGTRARDTLERVQAILAKRSAKTRKSAF